MVFKNRFRASAKKNARTTRSLSRHLNDIMACAGNDQKNRARRNKSGAMRSIGRDRSAERGMNERLRFARAERNRERERETKRKRKIGLVLLARIQLINKRACKARPVFDAVDSPRRADSKYIGSIVRRRLSRRAMNEKADARNSWAHSSR